MILTHTQIVSGGETNFGLAARLCAHLRTACIMGPTETGSLGFRAEQDSRTMGLAAANAANTKANNNNATFNCLLHGQNPTHNTDACSFLQNTGEERDKRQNNQNNRGWK
jgi:hypothetical protein